LRERVNTISNSPALLRSPQLPELSISTKLSAGTCEAVFGLATAPFPTEKRVYTFSDRPGPLLDAGVQFVSPDFFQTSQGSSR
jgi:hypothetical protein